MAGVKRGADETLGEMAAKRKKNDRTAPKYYAVRDGKVPGVYTTWPDCQAQTSGYKGAVYKSFLSRAEAEAFVSGKTIEASNGLVEPKFYAVARGNSAGIFSTWDEASAAIKNATAPRFKKFPSRHEAMDFIREFACSETVAAVEQGQVMTGPTASIGNGNKGPARQKAQTEKTKTKSKSKSKSEASGEELWKGHIHVYTDGSSRGNGRLGAIAGVGVWFGEDDPRNVSEPLKGELQTNQRAELTAILMALERVPHTEKILIITDSQYAINCATKWAKSWIAKDWHSSSGDEVKNQDLVKAIINEMKSREKAGGITSFKWVKGHNNDPGNVAADKLAVAGAMMQERMGYLG